MVSGWATVVASAMGVALLGVVVHLDLRVGATMSEVAALRAQMRAHPMEREEPGPPPQEAPRVVARGIDEATITAIASAVVRLQAQQAAVDKQAEAQAPVARRLDQEKSIADAGNAVTSAIARHKLTRDDVQKMRQELAAGAATSDEVDDLRSRIAVAINRQELVPEDRHFVYP
jgi:hypothetical protein